MPDVTRLIESARAGDLQAANRLLPLVYDELRNLAAARIAFEHPGHTLNATALVHEAYLRLVGNLQFEGRGHFFAAAAEAMRRILIDRARLRLAGKRGGGRRPEILPDDLPAPEAFPDDLLDLDDALSQLERHDLAAAQLVKLRYFAGLSHQDAADSLGISRGSADRLWVLARTWLLRQMSK